MTDLIRRALLQNDSEKARKFADQLVKRAIEGSEPASAQVLDRIEGKVPMQLTAEVDMNLQVVIRKMGE